MSIQASQLRRNLGPGDIAIGLFDNFLRTAIVPALQAHAQVLSAQLERPVTEVVACSGNDFTGSSKNTASAGADSASQHSAALMRVNHVGEVCAQALYQGHALGTRNPALRATFLRAAEEEAAHLDWTAQRIGELGGRTSLLNPLWYAGALMLGLLSTRFGEAHSLGFMRETEQQVEAHLHSHLAQLPVTDLASRAVIERMCADEAAHAQQAEALGAAELPAPVKQGMRACAKLMTTLAFHV